MDDTNAQYQAYELIRHYHEKESLLKEILKGSEPSVIDVGCGGYPANLYILFHDFQFKKLIGIEKESEEKAYATFLTNNNVKIDIQIFRNRYEFYKKHIIPEPQDLPLLNELDYYKTFNIKFNTKAEDYFKILSQNTFFDCLIISNMLHYLLPDDRKPFFTIVSAFQKTGGILYLRINKNFNEAEEDFLNLLNDYKQIFYYKTKNNKLDKVDSLIYLGIKK
jgi:hypothetical protein